MDSLAKRFPVYSKVIKLYPNKYRSEYGEQILQTTADMLDGSPNAIAKCLIWLKIAFDLPINITKQQLQYSGVIYTKDIPSYIKTNSVVSGTLLLPFVLALVANALDKLINGHTLVSSWLWRKPVIGLWILYLPLTALLIGTGSYLFYLTRNKKISLIKRVLDIKHSWPVIIPVVLAFGILFILAFHDSTQCWINAPIHSISHIGQAWQCTVNNQSLPVFKKLF